jgi:hypothetical protein
LCQSVWILFTMMELHFHQIIPIKEVLVVQKQNGSEKDHGMHTSQKDQILDVADVTSQATT